MVSDFKIKMRVPSGIYISQRPFYVQIFQDENNFPFPWHSVIVLMSQVLLSQGAYVFSSVVRHCRVSVVS